MTTEERRGMSRRGLVYDDDMSHHVDDVSLCELTFVALGVVGRAY